MRLLCQMHAGTHKLRCWTVQHLCWPRTRVQYLRSIMLMQNDVKMINAFM